MDYQFGPDTMTAPWGLDSRLKLVALACGFFDANKVTASHVAIGKRLADPRRPTPLSVTDFLKYLETTNAFHKTPSALRVARIVEEMVSAGLLVPVGHAKPAMAGLTDCYLYLPTADKLALRENVGWGGEILGMGVRPRWNR